ncbi:MAG TPA: ATP-binding protein [Candidatus Acidoferrales bacterium]|jgi:light-regulated signal transduction histidine kinase (bacteriophytochrome)|nr:ATP-binding protein [Candidatus Acidoferrales bacterium]
MSKGILYDSTLCIGCKACEGACAERWGLPYDARIAAGEHIPAHKLTAVETHGERFRRRLCICTAAFFDPFFTTREDQNRTGLGLDVAHSIVEQHAGEISVRSTPGEGTEFRLALPGSTGIPASVAVNPVSRTSVLGITRRTQ